MSVSKHPASRAYRVSTGFFKCQPAYSCTREHVLSLSLGTLPAKPESQVLAGGPWHCSRQLQGEGQVLEIHQRQAVGESRGHSIITYPSKMVLIGGRERGEEQTRSQNGERHVTGQQISSHSLISCIFFQTDTEH